MILHNVCMCRVPESACQIIGGALHEKKRTKNFTKNSTIKQRFPPLLTFYKEN